MNAIDMIFGYLNGFVYGNLDALRLFVIIFAACMFLMVFCIEEMTKLIKFYFGIFFIGLGSMMIFAWISIDMVKVCIWLCLVIVGVGFGLFYGNKCHNYYFYSGHEMDHHYWPLGGYLGLLIGIMVHALSASCFKFGSGFMLYIVTISMLIAVSLLTHKVMKIIKKSIC